jgi:hypothetical protein
LSVHLKFWKIQFWASSTTDFQQTFDRLSLVTHRSTTCCPPFRYIYCGCQPDYLLRQQIFNNTSKLSYYFYIVKMYVRCGNRFYFSRISGVMVRRARLKCCRSWISIPDKDKPNTATKKIRIMCSSGATCLSADCCFSDQAIQIQLSVLV